MADTPTPEQPNRRSLLTWAIFGLGAIFSAILGVPVVAYVIDPRHRKGPKSEMRLVEGVKLSDLIVDVPVQGVVRDTRLDGWTLYPNSVLGRVWVVKIADFPRGFDLGKLTDEDKETFFRVFTTICPHMGCSINTGGPGFACPCHAATFTYRGTRAAAGNPAQRGMDTLEWEIDPDDPEHDRVKVTYKRYRANDAKKVPLGGGDEETPNA